MISVDSWTNLLFSAQNSVTSTEMAFKSPVILGFQEFWKRHKRRVVGSNNILVGSNKTVIPNLYGSYAFSS